MYKSQHRVLNHYYNSLSLSLYLSLSLSLSLFHPCPPLFRLSFPAVIFIYYIDSLCFLYETGRRKAVCNYHQICKEMKMLLWLFAFEHFLFCIPLFILSFNISKRNDYLNAHDFDLGRLNLTNRSCLPRIV